MYKYEIFSRYYDINNFCEKARKYYQFHIWQQCINDKIESAVSAPWIVCIHALYPKSIDNYCTQTNDRDLDDTLKPGDPVITVVPCCQHDEMSYVTCDKITKFSYFHQDGFILGKVWLEYISAGAKVYVCIGYNFSRNARAPSHTPVITPMDL